MHNHRHLVATSHYSKRSSASELRLCSRKSGVVLIPGNGSAPENSNKPTCEREVDKTCQSTRGHGHTRSQHWQSRSHMCTKAGYVTTVGGGVMGHTHTKTRKRD
eukprot:1239748-Amphidinium_carterae.2